MIEIKDIKDLPLLIDDSKLYLEDALKNIHEKSKVLFDSNIKFKEFWDLIDSNGISIIFKYHNRYIIRKQKIGEIEMTKKTETESKMIFVETSELPKTNKGKTGKNWLEILNQIPVGKMWVTEAKENNASTIRQAIDKLVELKKLSVKEFTVTQREKDSKVMVYVIHNAKP